MSTSSEADELRADILKELRRVKRVELNILCATLSAKRRTPLDVNVMNDIFGLDEPNRRSVLVKVFPGIVTCKKRRTNDPQIPKIIEVRYHMKKDTEFLRSLNPTEVCRTKSLTETAAHNTPKPLPNVEAEKPQPEIATLNTPKRLPKVEAGKTMWKIPKDDFLRGSFEGAKLLLGESVWGITSNNQNPIHEDVVRLTICEERPKPTICQLSTSQKYGSITLLGFTATQSVVKSWIGTQMELEIKIDTSMISFMEKYLQSDGAVWIEFEVKAASTFTVDFASPTHGLISNTNDAASLYIAQQKIYVSKSYLSTQSPFFKSLFSNDIKKKEIVRFDQMKIEVFMQILAHLYSQFTACRKTELVPEVLKMARVLSCNSVMHTSELLLLRKNSLTVDDLDLADEFDLTSLRFQAVARVPVADLTYHMRQLLDKAGCELTRRLIIERVYEQRARSSALSDGKKKN